MEELPSTMESVAAELPEEAEVIASCPDRWKCVGNRKCNARLPAVQTRPGKPYFLTASALPRNNKTRNGLWRYTQMYHARILSDDFRNLARTFRTMTDVQLEDLFQNIGRRGQILPDLNA